MRIERRLQQPRWLLFAVPAGSIVFAFFASGLVLLATGHNPLPAYRQIFDAAFVNNGAIGQTLTQNVVGTTPVAVVTANPDIYRVLNQATFGFSQTEAARVAAM